MNEIKSVEEFDSTKLTSGIVVIDCWATWCAPCKMVAAYLPDLVNEYPSVTFAKYDIEVDSDLTEREDITSVPTLKIYKDGVIQKVSVGSLTKDNLKKIIDSLH